MEEGKGGYRGGCRRGNKEGVRGADKRDGREGDKGGGRGGDNEGGRGGYKEGGRGRDNLHCLLFGVLGWVSVQHFEISADVRRAI